jgi:hypothetical protein
MGDSVADILGKMYNFMIKSEQIYKLNYEIEQAFRQEQLDEDEHRHKELVKAIKGFTKNKKTATLNKKENTGKEEDSFLESILGGLKTWALGLLAELVSFAARVAALLRGAGLLGAAADLAAGLAAGSRVLGNNEPATKTQEYNNTNKKTKAKDKTKSKNAEVKKQTAKKVSGNSKQNRSQRRTAERQRTPAKLTKRAGNIQTEDTNAFYGFDPKSNLNYFQELVKRALEYREKYKSDWEPYRNEISKMVNGYDEFIAKQPFRADEEFETEIEKLPKYYIDPKSPKKVPEPYLDVDARPVFFDPISNVIKEIPGMKEVLKDQQKINQEKNTVIPLSHSEKALGLDKGESVVAVNTKVNNIGGKPPKIQSTAPAKQRDTAISRQLNNISVPV